MTREELKEHCEKQIEMCEFWAIGKGEEPHGKVYEEHKLILELLEQESVLDKVRAEIEEMPTYYREIVRNSATSRKMVILDEVIQILDKYKGESEET